MSMAQMVYFLEGIIFLILFTLITGFCYHWNLAELKRKTILSIYVKRVWEVT